MRRRRQPDHPESHLAERVAHERAVAEAFIIASALVEADDRVMSFEDARRETEAELVELLRARPELAAKLGRQP